jgi:hypothetical protein
MLDVVWAPVLGALSVLFDESQEAAVPETFGMAARKGGPAFDRPTACL